MNYEKYLTGWRFVAIIFLFALIARLPGLFMGFYNPDETVYAMIGQRILEGKTLYIDIVDHKPPLIYLLYALFVMVGGFKAIYVAHAFFILIIAGTGLTLSSIVKRLGGSDIVSALAAVLYIIIVSCGKPNTVAAANAEIFFNLYVALHFLYYIKSRDGEGKEYLYLVLSGLFAGIAILIKQQAVIPIAASFIYILFFERARLTDRLKWIVLMFVVMVTPFALFLLYLHSNGILGDAWYWIYSFNVSYALGSKSGAVLLKYAGAQTAYFVLLEQLSVWIPVVVCAFTWKHREKLIRRHGKLIILWFIMSIAALFPGLRFTPNYYIIYFPALSILGAFALVYLFTKKWSLKYLPLLALPITIAFVHSWVWALPIKSFHTKLEYYENEKVVNYLKEVVGANERVETWSLFNGIPFLAERRNGTRFLNKKHLTGNFIGGNVGAKNDKHWQWFMKDMNENKPEWFVDASSVDMAKDPVQKYPILLEFLNKHYRPYADVDNVPIYRLREN